MKSHSKKSQRKTAIPSSGRLDEFQWIAELDRIFTSPSMPQGLVLGIGDDAALLNGNSEELCSVSIDAQVESRHFRREWLGMAEVASRALHSAASDICAMGHLPKFALCSWQLPKDLSEAEQMSLAWGTQKAAEELGIRIIGGNLSAASEISLTTTVFGYGRKKLLRSGALPGDKLWLFGELGFAAAGLKFFERSEPSKSAAVRYCRERFAEPKAQLKAVKALQKANAAIDISDGLLADIGHLAKASKCSIVLDEASLQELSLGHLRSAAKRLDINALELILNGGEDYAIVASFPPRLRPSGGRCIGAVLSSKTHSPTISMKSLDGELHSLKEMGHQHF